MWPAHGEDRGSLRQGMLGPSKFVGWSGEMTLAVAYLSPPKAPARMAGGQGCGSQGEALPGRNTGAQGGADHQGLGGSPAGRARTAACASGGLAEAWGQQTCCVGTAGVT